MSRYALAFRNASGAPAMVSGKPVFIKFYDSIDFMPSNAARLLGYLHEKGKRAKSLEERGQSETWPYTGQDKAIMNTTRVILDGESYTLRDLEIAEVSKEGDKKIIFKEFTTPVGYKYSREEGEYRIGQEIFHAHMIGKKPEYDLFAVKSENDSSGTKPEHDLFAAEPVYDL